MKLYNYEGVVGNTGIVGSIEAKTIMEAKEKANERLRREYGRNARVTVIEEVKR